MIANLLKDWKVLIGVAVILLASGALFVSQRSSDVALTDCEIASLWFTLGMNEYEDFETFLRERYRIGGVVESGGWLKPARYSIAILENDHQEAEIVDFLVHRDGTLSSQMTMSISAEEWNRHETILCSMQKGES